MPEALPVAIVKCSACGAIDPGPREVCPKCHQAALVPATALGEGKLVSWTLIRRPPAQYREDGQYAVAIVRLDAGVQVTGRLKDPREEIKPGARVRAVAPLRNTVVFEVVS